MQANISMPIFSIQVNAKVFWGLDDEFGNPTTILNLTQCLNATFASGMNRGELEPALFANDEDIQGHTTQPDEDPLQEDAVSMTSSVASTTTKEAKSAKSAKKTLR